MNSVWCVFALFAMLAGRLSAQQPIDVRTAASAGITHVATALDHLTVLEFSEPVVMAASGSAAFQIERHDSRVFVKPLKPGVATNLFVWTASARFSYELDPPGEVKTMNFAVDNAITSPKPLADGASNLAQVADLVLTRAFLGSELVDSSSVKNSKDGVTVRVERVLRTKNGIYIHYWLCNHGTETYHINTPLVYELEANRPAVSLVALGHVQLSAAMVSRLGKTEQVSIPVAHAEVQHNDIDPGGETQGVVAIREQLDTPVAIQLVFGSQRGRTVLATLVL